MNEKEEVKEKERQEEIKSLQKTDSQTTKVKL